MISGNRAKSLSALTMSSPCSMHIAASTASLTSPARRSRRVMSSFKIGPWPRPGWGPGRWRSLPALDAFPRLTRCQGRLTARGLVAIRTKAHNGNHGIATRRGPLRASVSQSRAGLWKGLVASIRVQENVGVEASACIWPFEEVQRIRHVGDVNRQSRSKLRGTNGAGWVHLMPRRISSLTASLTPLPCSARSRSTAPAVSRRIPPWCACRNGSTSVYIKACMVMRPPVERNRLG